MVQKLQKCFIFNIFCSNIMLCLKHYANLIVLTMIRNSISLYDLRELPIGARQYRRGMELAFESAAEVSRHARKPTVTRVGILYYAAELSIY